MSIICSSRLTIAIATYLKVLSFFDIEICHDKLVHAEMHG